MRVPVLAIGLLLAMAAPVAAQTVEVPAELRLAVVRRVLATRQSQLNDSIGLTRCGLAELVGAASYDTLEAEGRLTHLPDVRCVRPGSGLPPVQWFSIESIRRRSDGLFEVSAQGGYTCSYRREESYLLESMPYGMVVREIRIHGWESQVCEPLGPMRHR